MLEEPRIPSYGLARDTDYHVFEVGCCDSEHAALSKVAIARLFDGDYIDPRDRRCAVCNAPTQDDDLERPDAFVRCSHCRDVALSDWVRVATD